MKDIDKLLIISFICMFVLLYPFYEIVIKFDFNRNPSELYFPAAIALICGLILVLFLRWYKNKHLEEFKTYSKGDRE